MTLYHTALSTGSITYKNVPETTKAMHSKGTMLQNDIIKQGLPEAFDECDVFYSEPPWTKGFKVFNERANVTDSSYQDLISALQKIILQTSRPVYLTSSKSMIKGLPEPNQLFETKLNGGDALLGVWNDEYFDDKTNTNVICQNLGKRYFCMGDFTCGYGDCILNFLKGGGQRFVASDFDGKCITVMSTRFKKVK